MRIYPDGRRYSWRGIRGSVIRCYGKCDLFLGAFSWVWDPVLSVMIAPNFCHRL